MPNIKTQRTGYMKVKTCKMLSPPLILGVRLFKRLARRIAMSLPRVPFTQSQERIGVSIVAETVSRMNLIWRETPTTDVGIDGQIEFVNDLGEATGQIVAVQVKTGPSYLKGNRNKTWVYYPSDAHRRYWEQFPVPVLLFLCDPGTRRVFWVDARQLLRSQSKVRMSGIHVPKTSILEEGARGSLFASIGEIDGHFLEVDELVNALMERKIDKPGYSASFFDFFATGLTNIANTLYFGMDLVCKVAEARTEVVSTGDDEHQFAYDYMRFVVAQQLADVPWSECMIDWREKGMVPSWMARLTRRGREIVEHVHELEKKFRKSGIIAEHPMLHVMQETPVSMQWTPSAWRRIDLSQDFQNAYLRDRSQHAPSSESSAASQTDGEGKP
jgi:hypothetical protein